LLAVWTIAVAIVLVLGLLVILLLRKPKELDQPLLLEAPSAGRPSAGAPLQLNPELPATAAVAPPTKVTPQAAITPAPVVAPPQVVLPSLPQVVTRPAAPSAPATANAARAARCYADPFTGQLRVAGAGHTSDSFACRQNPFTGAYQRQ
jgi:hypothetical protein